MESQLIETKRYHSQIPHLRLVLTEACNLKCQYCHATQLKIPDTMMMSPVTALSSMRTFASEISSRKYYRADLSLYGGEPLLNKPTLYAILDELSNNSPTSTFQFNPVLNTNGLLVKHEQIEKFKRSGIRVHVSLNGTDEISNASRKTRDGKSTVKKTLECLYLLRDSDIPFQINCLITEHNFDRLEQLIELAESIRCPDIFLGLQDGHLNWLNPKSMAKRLLEIEGRALHANVNLHGPWNIGSEAEDLDHYNCLPINLIVQPDGRVFIPQYRQEVFDSIQTFFSESSYERINNLGREWFETIQKCDACSLCTKCRGYLKMMVTYHTGSQKDSLKECTTARMVHSLRLEQNSHAPLRTTLDLRIKELNSSNVKIWNALLPDRQLVVSHDVIQILDWFLQWGTFASLRTSFISDNLKEAIDQLINSDLLVYRGGDTDVELMHCLGVTKMEKYEPGILIGAQDGKSFEILKSFIPWLQEAFYSLPYKLQSRDSRICVVGVADETSMEECLGLEKGDPSMKWMAATVFNSIIIINIARVEKARKFGGEMWLGQIKRGLLHEFVHLALRQYGIRIPIWLEEGICEMISNHPPSTHMLANASSYLDDLCGFILERSLCGGAISDPCDGLLKISNQPINENPAYTLVHDLILFIIKDLGNSDILFDGMASWGVSGLVDPFPMSKDGEGILRLGLKGILKNWETNLTDRISLFLKGVSKEPFRVVCGTTRSILYNRLLGGYWMWDNSPDDVFHVLEDRNLSQEEVHQILSRIPADEGVLQRWRQIVCPERRIKHLRLHVHTGCNLSCDYCYNQFREGRPMSIEVADQAIRWWRNHLQPGDEDDATIRFFGGEPLLNWSVILHVLDNSTIGWPGHGPRFLLNTNGTLLRSKHVERLANERNRLTVGLSIDGIGATYDLHRRQLNGQSAFEAVNRAAISLAEARIPLGLVIVISEHNVNKLSEIVDFALRLRNTYQNPISLVLEPVIDRTGFGRNLVNLSSALDGILYKCHIEGLPVTGKLFNSFDALTDPNGATDHFCSATGAEISVGPTGELLFCSAVPDPPYGTLRDIGNSGMIPLPKKYITRRASNMPSCRDCEIAGLCGGGCAAQSALYSGDIYGNPGKAFCTLIRDSFYKLLSFSLSRGSASSSST